MTNSSAATVPSPSDLDENATMTVADALKIILANSYAVYLKTKNFQGRTVGLMENGTWAPMAAKLMRAELDGMKNITVCDAVVTIRSAANAAAEAQMDVLADELLAK